MSLRLPEYEAGARPASGALLRAIWENDQFDDWLPDAVYYEDQRRNEAAAVARIEKLWQAGELPPPASEPLALPRASGKTVPALALPLDARVVAHGVIAALAPRVCGAVPRDKVYGFEFSRDSCPLFTVPGGGLGAVYENVFEVARKAYNKSFRDRDAADHLYVLDVVSFNASARMASLSETLRQAGARPAETDFLRQLGGAGAAGLPSVDDAFAFLYNFYLRPVDQALAEAKLNFFRYRDEYFLFSQPARALVEQSLRRMQLDSRLAAEFQLSRIIDELFGAVVRENDGETETGVKSLSGAATEFDGEGALMIRLVCDDWVKKEKACNSDRYEINFEFHPSKSAPQEMLFKLPARAAPLDAVRILPLLRAIHRQRRAGVTLRPPFAGAPAEFARHRAALEKGRAWLGDALRTAIASNAGWQVTWVAPLLSDLGPLTAAEATMLRQVALKGAMDEAAKAQARLALARSAPAAASDWAAPSTGASNHRTRAAILGARHLLARGVAGPWAEVEPTARASEPELTSYLSSEIKGIN